MSRIVLQLADDLRLRGPIGTRPAWGAPVDRSFVRRYGKIPVKIVNLQDLVNRVTSG